MKFSSLPHSLIALLFTYPIIAAPTSHNDPFRTIALKQPEPVREPICCLVPPPRTEPKPTDDELLLSFEDWKAKLLAEERSSSATALTDGADSSHHVSQMDPVQAANTSEGSNQEGGSGEGKGDRPDPSLVPHSTTPGTSGQPLSQDQVDLGLGESLLPHFRVPLTDRFNYASSECSARIHKAHKSAKSSSSILSSKKDRYMLSPCATKTPDGKEESHFVIVELCEDIRIDTVQLANFEFFSGVFKDFTVSVAKTYTPDVPEWTTVGKYHARNIRGVQSFHPPNSLRDFYRYIRIDFHSHYGSEFYCPVSLLRVYGLTHLEEWKWDSRANRYEQLQIPAHTPSQKANLEPTPSTPAEPVVETISLTQTTDPPTGTTSEPGCAKTKTDAQPSGDAFTSVPEPTPVPHDGEVDGNSPLNSGSSPASPTNSPQSSLVASHSPSSPSPSTPAPTPQTTEVIPSITVRSPPHAPSSQGTQVVSLGTQALVPPPQVSTGGGESIYRTIMNRIVMLELNATLHARYVEEHTVGVREVLKRLTEEVGRLEGIGKAQAQMYQRSLVELQRHQRRLELEHGELMSRVQYLAEEITMEKRLGIAQLCIMVAVLVFMALTRGSRGESVDHDLLHRFSRRNRTMSWSGEWMRRFRTGSNPTPSTLSLGGTITRRATSDHGKIDSSNSVTPRLDRLDRTQNRYQNGTQTASNSLKRSSGRARTPQTRTPKTVRVSTTATPSHRPTISRVNSQGQNWMSQSVSSSVIHTGSKSAKRWARTAHVHEIKRKTTDSGASSQSEAEIETPNDSSSRIGWSNKGKQKETELTSRSSFIIGESHSRRGSFGRTPLRPTSSTNVIDAEVTDSWVDTDDASSSEKDVYPTGTPGRFTRSADILTIHTPSPGLVGVGAS